MRLATISITLLILISFISCSAQEKDTNSETTTITDKKLELPPFPNPIKLNIDSIRKTEIEEVPFESPRNRSAIVKNLRSKVDSGEFLIVHVFVPLCDNEHQGIVPTSASIGNGMDAYRNLYWGTSKGMKRFFKELPDWKMVHSETNVNSNVLDRAIFEKTYPNKAKVRLVMDAYRGDKMELCLEHYFMALAGITMDTILVDSNQYPAYGNADLIVFNGHNGLMDESPRSFTNTDSRPKDAVSISCISKSFFKPFWEESGSYPLVMTTGLMYPGAYGTEFIINDWAMLKTAESCRAAAGKAYYKYKPKSGPNGSNNLFSTGW
ncbi:MAG: hypothetical protein JKY54_19850 [Flavobacteriales bacterium]|nr:hypothetical protein [Flavobacteriales bacterium]